MISSIQLQGFKGHRDTEVSLGRLTVLVGPNGAGKTSVLQALALMGKVTTGEPSEVLRGDWSPQDLCHRGGAETIHLMERGQDETGAHWFVSLNIPEPLGGAEPRGPSKLKSKPILHGRVGVELIQPSMLADFVGPAVLYKFDAQRIAGVAHSAEEDPSVEEDGGNAAVVLAALKLEREEVFTQVEGNLRKIVPSLQRVRIRRVRVPGGSLMGNKIFLDFEGALDIPAHGASEGTLITLALLTVLCSPNRPKVILLDDIDRSLHPQAQMELMKELKRLLEEFPGVQIVATTHSPYILDELEPEDVRVFVRRKNGSVACKLLSEHPQAAEVRGSLTSGQLWSLDPESRWVGGEG
ncbi:ATP-binding protein [Stigmatella sp. ncwal1]|uniref:ATP-binding protein n=1 Tax=Stigmatella ashevillensis TaxID=2995309 RepID=A0ABT5DCP0_9BACT|nr:ATP-binding protein [Stigmatella ashevillena]MDC0710102.1 ATP-binding protein [Stigmatella ashevillena]